jgi:hypothetical protein
MDFAFTEEQTMFKEQIIRFARKEIVPRSQEHDLKGEFDFESFRKLGDFGILGLHFPESLGGSDADVVTSALAGEALGEAGVDGVPYHTGPTPSSVRIPFSPMEPMPKENNTFLNWHQATGLVVWVSRNRKQDLTFLPLVPGPRSVGIGIS